MDLPRKNWLIERSTRSLSEFTNSISRIEKPIRNACIGRNRKSLLEPVSQESPEATQRKALLGDLLQVLDSNASIAAVFKVSVVLWIRT